MKTSLFFSFEIIFYNLIFIILSAGSPPLPPKYDDPDNIDVINSLKATVRRELHIVEYTKNIGYYTSDEAINKVLIYDEEISAAGQKYDVPKEMIQAVLFKELRMIDFRDGISDYLVKQCFKIHENLSANADKTFLCRFFSALTNTKGSSTGIGQIFPKTAIKAHNWYFVKKDDADGNIIDCKDISEREEMWHALQDEQTSIGFVALILKYEAEANLGININNASDEDIKDLFVRYNGAEYYGDEVFKYYSLFKEIKAS